MVSQGVWIGIVVVAFVVGIGTGYAVFSGTVMPYDSMSLQNRQQMMGQMLTDPEMRDHMTESIIQDPQHMQSWMADEGHAHEMAQTMKDDHNFMVQMMSVMLEDPSIRLQMIGHMTENPEAMEQMNQMMSGEMSQGMMGSGMMNQEMMMKLMDDPQTREKMIEIMKEHVSEMNDLLSSNLTEQEFNEKMASMMQEHMKDMQDLMPNQMSHG